MKFLAIMLLVLTTESLKATEHNIYIDADFSHYTTSSKSIFMGIKTALEYKKESLQSLNINLIQLDHKANSRRSLKNLKAIQKDPKSLVTFSGMHSPPVLANKKFINDNKLLFFSPWAAAAPITRTTNDENWIFRVSVDDSIAGDFLVSSLVELGYKKPFLLLEQTGWGQSNFKTMSRALESKKIQAQGVEFFNWEPTEVSINTKIRKIIELKADCILFVGNANEGQVFANALQKLNVKVPVLSHWGINAGGFFKNITPEILNDQKWNFIQTKFSFINSPQEKLHKEVLALAQKLFPQEIKDKDIQSSTGFIHAFDATLLIVQGIEQVGTKELNATTLKQSLENLQKSVNGLVKTYKKPFSRHTGKDEFAHEALGIDDLRLGYFNTEGQVLLNE
ncbi:MAG: ABC transporter substrate-binding protein [Lentisphaeraceae bacterium]|nr:ABC transporter substrate-binding protein [Lentisphaeraceae bacterium]